MIAFKPRWPAHSCGVGPRANSTIISSSKKVVPDHDSKMKVAGRKHAADANGAKTKPVIKLVTMLSGSLASIGREVLNRISQKTGARAVPKKAVLTCPANASP
jgi:hypothetical protein